jgi:hypothetical protein
VLARLAGPEAAAGQHGRAGSTVAVPARRGDRRRLKAAARDQRGAATAAVCAGAAGRVTK